MEMIIKCWDGKCVAFHPESGNTHLLSLAYANILERLRRNESIGSIVDTLIAEDLAGDRHAALALLQSAQQEFRQLHLIS